MATKMEHTTLHIVCWYPVLTGSIKLLVTPGGGILAGIIAESLMIVVAIVEIAYLCLDHEKGLERE